MAKQFSIRKPDLPADWLSNDLNDMRTDQEVQISTTVNKEPTAETEPIINDVSSVETSVAGDVGKKQAVILKGLHTRKADEQNITVYGHVTDYFVKSFIEETNQTRITTKKLKELKLISTLAECSITSLVDNILEDWLNRNAEAIKKAKKNGFF